VLYYIHVPTLKNQESDRIGFSSPVSATDTSGMGKQMVTVAKVEIETNEATPVGVPASQADNSAIWLKLLFVPPATTQRLRAHHLQLAARPAVRPQQQKQPKMYTLCRAFACMQVLIVSPRGTLSLRDQVSPSHHQHHRNQSCIPTTRLIQFPLPLTLRPGKPKAEVAMLNFVSGKYQYIIAAEIRQRSDEQARSRRLHIKNTMKGLRGMGTRLTRLVDSLDTLWLMNQSS
jgi:hypothetical protein